MRRGSKEPLVRLQRRKLRRGSGRVDRATVRKETACREESRTERSPRRRVRRRRARQAASYRRRRRLPQPTCRRGCASREKQDKPPRARTESGPCGQVRGYARTRRVYKEFRFPQGRYRTKLPRNWRGVLLAEVSLQPNTVQWLPQCAREADVAAQAQTCPCPAIPCHMRCVLVRRMQVRPRD